MDTEAEAAPWKWMLEEAEEGEDDSDSAGSIGEEGRSSPECRSGEVRWKVYQQSRPGQSARREEGEAEQGRAGQGGCWWPKYYNASSVASVPLLSVLGGERASER
jgi:hypothetical protein